MNDEYYERVNSVMKGGYLALIEKIQDIQEHIAEAVTNQIIDLDGQAFVLTADKAAFQLIPITNGLDLSNDNADGWQDLQDLYVRRKMNFNKNGVKNIILKFRNLTTSDQHVTCKLYDDQYETDYSVAPINSQILTILPSDEVGVEYEVKFDVIHLLRGYHYLVIERTNVAGVDLQTSVVLS